MPEFIYTLNVYLFREETEEPHWKNCLNVCAKQQITEEITLFQRSVFEKDSNFALILQDVVSVVL